MTEAAEVVELFPGQEKKTLYELGEIPPLGHVPNPMYAWAIRRERHGDPDTAMQVEVVETPKLDSHDVLIMVMAAGVNYHAEIVREKAIMRRLLETALDISRMAYESSGVAKDLLDEAERRIFEIARVSVNTDIKNISDILQDTFSRSAVRTGNYRHSGSPCGHAGAETRRNRRDAA